MKWFSIDGVKTEIKRVRWPKGEDLLQYTSIVLVFTIAFGIFFIASDFVVAWVIKFLGLA